MLRGWCVPGTARNINIFGTETFSYCIYHGNFIAFMVNYFLDYKKVESNPEGDIFSIE